MTWPDAAVLLVAEPTVLAAYLVYGLYGFGTTLVAAPILAHVLPVATVIPALALTDFCASVGHGLRQSAQVDKAEALRLVPAMLAGSTLGAWLLFALPLRELMLALGVFVIAYALNGLRPKAPALPIAGVWAWWYGAAGGVLSALFGSGGFVYAMYLSRRVADPVRLRATQSAVLTASATIRVVIFALAGRYFDSALLILVACLMPVMVLGMVISHHITLRLSREVFLRGLYVLLLATGGGLVLRALTQA